MHGEELQFIQNAFDTNWIAPLGPHVDAFEQEMASYLKVGHAAALSSGTGALHLAVKLAGVEQGDVVLCSDLTFSATVNPVSYEKGTQVFVDSERETWNMDPRALRKAFDKYPQAKAVIVVNLYGTPAKLDEIRSICQEHNAVLIEDAAESLSARYKGQQTGTFGQYGIVSFNGNKIITTSGGGMLLSDNEDDIKKARFWATQARDPAPHYQHSEIGYNYRMSNVIAGIGRGQLLHLEEHKNQKKRIYERYQQELSALPLSMNPYTSECEPNFWLSCILLNEDVRIRPNEIMECLAQHNIEARPIWKPMHMQPVFAGHEFITVADTPVDEDVFERGLCLPSDIKMTEEQQDVVIQLIKDMFR